MDIKRIVEQCKTGDREAFGALYRTYLNKMRTVVACYVHDSDAVWDVLHDGFLIAFVSIGSLKDAAKVEVWLTSIMKNLALSYLKEEAKRVKFSLSEVSISEDADNDSHETAELTWEELDTIINQLPTGYGNVFRLAVLDGMTHKEIGALLGIAPHSSSSQLAHAKAMLRRLITKYKAEIGALSIIAVSLLIWNSVLRHRNDSKPPKIGETSCSSGTDIVDPITENDAGSDNKILKARNVDDSQRLVSEDAIAEAVEPKDSVTVEEKRIIAADSTSVIPQQIDYENYIAENDIPFKEIAETSDWSLSLAFSGTSGHNDMNRYMAPNPSIPDVEGPTGEIEVTKKVHHYMPVVVGLSLNKPLTSRWSIETGLRYTFLRSDFLSESELMHKETIQRIHYIGVPLKLNYRMFTYNGFSLYGQGGVALDIPVYGTQSILEYSPQSGTTNKDFIRINAPLQWSVEGGLGIQYHFTPSFSIYAEPSFRYYFNAGSDIRTIRQEKPFEFTIPMGFRFTW